MRLTEYAWFICGLLCVLAALPALAPPRANAAQKTDAQKDGLSGPVKTVRVETAAFTTEDGKRVEGERTPFGVATYDEKGNKIETQGYQPQTAVPSNKTTYTYTYDANGRRTEMLRSAVPGPSLGKVVYTYNSAGQLVEESEYVMGEKTPQSVTTYEYDVKGNVKEEARTTLGHSLGSTVLKYDSKGHPVEEAQVDTKGNVRARYRHTYDAKGNATLTEGETALGGTGGPVRVKRRYEYKYDSHGSWTKKTTSSWDYKTSKWAPMRIEYRTIAYYT